MGDSVMGAAYMDEYRAWLQGDEFDFGTKRELEAIKGDEKEIEDRFYKTLDFGTAGLRGVLGAGTNRMNSYTVGKVTQGLCDAVNAGALGCSGSKPAQESGIAISFDPRRRSREFAYECAAIIAANGIKAYVFEDIRPTPVLSFTVRCLGCVAGIMVTASHNPAEYNGYKVYGPDGAQMSVADSAVVAQAAQDVPGYGAIRRAPVEEAIADGRVKVIGKDIDDMYVERVRALSLRLGQAKGAAESLRIVYTPLHGAGNKLVRRVLTENGFRNVFVVPEQELPDPDFSTVKSPNPESLAAFELAVDLAKKVDASVIIGTDPDSDRLGVVYRDHAGEYVALTGNQIGCMLLEYVLTALEDAGGPLADSFAVTTIVSSKLAARIAASHGVALHEVYTGFKYICGLAEKLEKQGGRFVFGFEESNGYLAGTFVRDKDAVIASMFIAEMAAWLSSQGLTLADAVSALYGKYGYMSDAVVSYTLEGKAGLEAIASAMEALRRTRPSAFGDFKVTQWSDYLTLERHDSATGATGPIDMPETSNVLAYAMEGGAGFLVRPSGTEPKIKIYYGAPAKDREEAEAIMRRLQADVSKVVEGLLGI